MAQQVAERIGLVRQARSARPSIVSAGAEISYGGVGIELLMPPHFGSWSLPAWQRSFTTQAAGAAGARASRICARVTCTVMREAITTEDRHGAPSWAWAGEHAIAECRGARVELRRVTEGRYAATARVDSSDHSVGSLVRTLATVIAHREGGFFVDAALLEIDEQGVLLLGSSRSLTTLALEDRVRLLASERVAVFHAEGRFFAAGVAGGQLVETDGSAAVPISSVILARIGGTAPWLGPLDHVDLVNVLREVAGPSGGNREDEERRLEALRGFAHAVSAATLHSCDGASHAELLARVVGSAPHA